MSDSSDLQQFFSNLVIAVGAYEYLFAIVDLLLNSFHVFILSRRRMRTSSMNSILLGIALVDIAFPIIAIKKKVRIWIVGEGACSPPEGLLEYNIDWLLYTLRDDFRRCSTWLGVMLAAVRTVAVRNKMNPKYNHVSHPNFGWKIVFIVLTLSTLFSIFYYFRFQVVPAGELWIPPSGCPPIDSVIPAKLEEREFYSSSNGLVRKINLLVVGTISKILPCFLFPILTILLVRELGKAREAREKARKDGSSGNRKDVSTRLVIYMTVSFFIIEFPIGICFWIEAASSTYSTGSVTTSIIQLLNMIYVAMTLSHLFICFSMSSQYRKTVKSLFSKPHPIKTTSMMVTVVQNPSSVY